MVIPPYGRIGSLIKVTFNTVTSEIRVGFVIIRCAGETIALLYDFYLDLLFINPAFPNARNHLGIQGRINKEQDDQETDPG